MYVSIYLNAVVQLLMSLQGRETMDIDIPGISVGPESEEGTTPAEVCHLLIYYFIHHY